SLADAPAGRRAGARAPAVREGRSGGRSAAASSRLAAGPLPLRTLTRRSRMSRIPRNASRGIPAALVLALTAMLGPSVSPATAAPIGFQATGGWYTNQSDFFLGAGARMAFGTLTAIPNAEWLFVDGGNQYTLNIDGTMSVLPLGVASGYVGAGLGWIITDPDRGSRNTDTVFNLIAGPGLNTLPLKPFAQFKYVIASGDDPVQFAFGVRF